MGLRASTLEHMEGVREGSGEGRRHGIDRETMTCCEKEKKKICPCNKIHFRRLVISSDKVLRAVDLKGISIKDLNRSSFHSKSPQIDHISPNKTGSLSTNLTVQCSAVQGSKPSPRSPFIKT